MFNMIDMWDKSDTQILHAISAEQSTTGHPSSDAMWETYKFQSRRR